MSGRLVPILQINHHFQMRVEEVRARALGLRFVSHAWEEQQPDLALVIGIAADDLITGAEADIRDLEIARDAIRAAAADWAIDLPTEWHLLGVH